MKKSSTHSLRMRLCLVGLLALPGTVFGQGSLTPPGGTPAPTMKTLDEVEPRINIQRTVNPLPNNGSYHYIISTPGSYYLSANLDVTKPNGIQVTAPGVTIDLQGFLISRSSGAGGVGIDIDPTADRCVVKNGALAGWAIAVRCLVISNIVARGGAFLDLSVTGCSMEGLSAGRGWLIDGCKAHNNTGTPILARDGCVISNCTVSDNQIVNGTAAISAAAGCTLVNCTANNNQVIYVISTFRGSTISNCTASFNQTTYAILVDGGTVINCSTNSNTSAQATSAGIHASAGSTIIGCTSDHNSSTAAASISTGMGIDAGTGVTIKDCTTTFNKGTGIWVASSCLVTGSNSSHNGVGSPNGDGIRTNGDNNRIDGNHVVGNSQWGIRSSTTNYIIRNTATGNGTANYNPDTGPHFGPLSTVQTATSPWANF